MTPGPTPGTFAGEAAKGVFYELGCTACYAHHTFVSARTMCDRGYADVQVVGVQRRMRCSTCGVKGRVKLTMHGLWTGPVEGRPADWAARIEERLPHLSRPG